MNEWWVNICFLNYWAPSLAPDRSTEALIATVRFVEILLRPNGNNTGRVNGFMAAVIVVTDMRKTHRLGDTLHLVDVAQETVQIEVITDAPFIAVTYTGSKRTSVVHRRMSASVS